MKLVAIALALAALALGEDPAGKFKLIQTTLVLPAGAGSQTFTVLIKGAGLKIDAKHPVTPSLADANTPASPPVQVTTKFVSSSNPAAACQPPDSILAVRSPFTLYLRPAHDLPYGTLKYLGKRGIHDIPNIKTAASL